MTLDELLDKVDENTYIRVVNPYDELLAEYDGRNSIPIEVDSLPIDSIWVEHNILYVGVDDDGYLPYSLTP